MSFRTKLVLLLLVVAVVPVTLSGILSIATSQREMTARIAAFQSRDVELGAQSIADFLSDTARSLQLASEFIPFEQFPREELSGALRIPYRQFDQIAIAGLVNAEGSLLTTPVFEASPEENPSLVAHESVTIDEALAFPGRIPREAALLQGLSFGVAYTPAGGPGRLPLAVSFPVRSGTARWVLAAELSLRQICKRLRESPSIDDRRALLVDSAGNYLCPEPNGSRAAHPLVKAGFEAGRLNSERYTDSDGVEMIGSFALVAPAGLGFIVEQPTGAAFQAARRILQATLLWIALSLAIAIFGGLLFGRGVSGPIRDLSEGVDRLGRGDFNHRLPVRSRDEIGRLGAAFNQMAATMHMSFETMRAQNDEIGRWNQELLERVDQRTRELQEAQDQIVLSQKLAATAELGAGVAHEINNPLTGILGYAELIDSRGGNDPDLREALTAIISSTRRIQTIVQDLERFSRSPISTSHTTVDLNAVAKHALMLLQQQLTTGRIEVQTEFAPDLPALIGNSDELVKVFLHLISNGRNAMPEGGLLTIATSTVDGGAIRAVVSDTGHGIPAEILSRIFEPFFTTKNAWAGSGLGLSVTHRIIQEHKGKISVQSEVGHGSSFTLLFPGFRRDLHLR